MKLFLICFFITTCLFAQTLTISYPERSEHMHITSVIMKEAYKRLNINTVFIAFPANRSLREVQNANVDAELHRVKGLEASYTNLVMVPIRLSTFEAAVFSTHKNLDIQNWESLNTLQVGVQLGFKFARTELYRPNIKTYSDIEKAFKLLNLGRLNAIVYPKLIGLKLIHANNFNNIYLQQKALLKSPLYHYVHKKHEHLVPKLTQVLKQLQKEGFIQKAYQNHISAFYKQY